MVSAPAAIKTVRESTPQAPVSSIPDERLTISPKDPSILIIEDDPVFAELLSNICKEKGFLFLASATGEEGIELARRYLPKGILLDINLPGMNGWEVLENLKSFSETRHIPVHIVSAYEETMEALNKGASGFCPNPSPKKNWNWHSITSRALSPGR